MHNKSQGDDHDSRMSPIDKSTWKRGPWDHEPDRKEWRHRGFVCLIRRAPHIGVLCGYVAVPPGHPWHGKHYEDVDARVHGGLTYASKCRDDICHVPQPGESDDVWWLGFDHGHGGDIAPALPGLSFQFGATYYGMAEVTAGVESLADQAAQALGSN